MACDVCVTDDEPDDGPQHYVIISGFHHPHLLSYLSDIGVNVDCIIKVQSEDYHQLDTVLAAVQALDPPSAAPVEPCKRSVSLLTTSCSTCCSIQW